jgi:hypothetical protein
VFQRVLYNGILNVTLWRVFEKELYNGIPNVTVWRVLRNRLHLKAYKLSIIRVSIGDRSIGIVRSRTKATELLLLLLLVMV